MFKLPHIYIHNCTACTHVSTYGIENNSLKRYLSIENKKEWDYHKYCHTRQEQFRDTWFSNAHLNTHILMINTYIHTYIQTYKHTYIHTNIHTYIHIYNIHLLWYICAKRNSGCDMKRMLHSFEPNDRQQNYFMVCKVSFGWVV